MHHNVLTLLSSIIDERRNHSNFQLIVITHDENFLERLGQSDVSEYYWYVPRSARTSEDEAIFFLLGEYRGTFGKSRSLSGIDSVKHLFFLPVCRPIICDMLHSRINPRWR